MVFLSDRYLTHLQLRLWCITADNAIKVNNESKKINIKIKIKRKNWNILQLLFAIHSIDVSACADTAKLQRTINASTNWNALFALLLLLCSCCWPLLKWNVAEIYGAVRYLAMRDMSKMPVHRFCNAHRRIVRQVMPCGMSNHTTVRAPVDYDQIIMRMLHRLVGGVQRLLWLHVAHTQLHE